MGLILLADLVIVYRAQQEHTLIIEEQQLARLVHLDIHVQIRRRHLLNALLEHHLVDLAIQRIVKVA